MIITTIQVRVSLGCLGRVELSSFSSSWGVRWSLFVKWLRLDGESSRRYGALYARRGGNQIQWNLWIDGSIFQLRFYGFPLVSFENQHFLGGYGEHNLVLLKHFSKDLTHSLASKTWRTSYDILLVLPKWKQEKVTVSQYLRRFKTPAVIPTFSPSIHHFAIRRQFPRMRRQFPSKLHSNCAGRRVARLSVVNFQTTTAVRIDGEGPEGYRRSYYHRRAIFGTPRSKM